MGDPSIISAEFDCWKFNLFSSILDTPKLRVSFKLTLNDLILCPEYIGTSENYFSKITKY